MIAFIDAHREVHGVEPICRVLPIAPSPVASSAGVFRAMPGRLRAQCLGAGAARAAAGREERARLLFERGPQYVSIGYTERLADAGIEPCVDSVGDSYDNALAETINGLFKAEVIRPPSWRSVEASSSPPCTGATGSTPVASSNQSATSRPLTPKPPTTPTLRPGQLPRRDLTNWSPGYPARVNLAGRTWREPLAGLRHLHLHGLSGADGEEHWS